MTVYGPGIPTVTFNYDTITFRIFITSDFFEQAGAFRHNAMWRQGGKLSSLAEGAPPSINQSVYSTSRRGRTAVSGQVANERAPEVTVSGKT